MSMHTVRYDCLIMMIGPASEVSQRRAGMWTASRLTDIVVTHPVPRDAAMGARLFTQGFTTREGGQGLGLHRSCLAAKLLRGTLSAASEGEGQGATFTLDLPLVQVALAA